MARMALASMEPDRLIAVSKERNDVGGTHAPDDCEWTCCRGGGVLAQGSLRLERSGAWYRSPGTGVRLFEADAMGTGVDPREREESVLLLLLLAKSCGKRREPVEDEA
jgi:hypothetical protein